MLGKLIAESPLWMMSVVCFTGTQWKEGDPRASPSICEKVKGLTDWLEERVERHRLWRRDSFHKLFLEAYALEHDEKERVAARELVFALEREYEEYGKAQRIQSRPGEWTIMGVHPPGASERREPLTWGETFGSEDFRDPVSFLAFRLRRALEREDQEPG